MPHRSFAAALFAMLMSAPLAAAEIAHQPVGEAAGFIIVQGQIELGDEIAFTRAADRYERAVVLMVSPGGSAVAGMAIGETMRARRFSAGVAPGTTCASACALAWLGAFNRYMSATSRVGFHAVYVTDRDGKRVSSTGNALVGAYAQRMGLPSAAIDLIVRADPDTVEWLTPAKAKAAGIDLRLLEVAAPAESAPARAQYEHFVTGLDPLGDNWLALKAEPDIRSKRLAKLPPDIPLRVIGRSGRWAGVELKDGRFGWVAIEYVGCCRR